MSERTANPRFNSVGRRNPQGPSSVTVRAWPPTPPIDEDEEWDAVIARAKMRTSAVPPELQVTPPPVPVRQASSVPMGSLHAQRLRTVEEVRAKLDVIVRGGVKRSTVLPPRR